ncbi:12503_t:CDS:2 [Acaulospora morrowiae]|uniref:12503_t:CDS:1 n=1 Tax=Acaulospora morrowiae TaxID=94023 RepID=A0A9N9ETI7_9GLOM|nr:12503_t:CDS:2 [Acaulospora morrowiae]
MAYEKQVKINDDKKIKPKITLHDPLPLGERIKRTIRKMPPEVVPFVVIISAAIFGGLVALGHKLATDNQLRKYPTHRHTVLHANYIGIEGKLIVPGRSLLGRYPSAMKSSYHREKELKGRLWESSKSLLTISHKIARDLTGGETKGGTVSKSDSIERENFEEFVETYVMVAKIIQGEFKMLVFLAQ